MTAGNPAPRNAALGIAADPSRGTPPGGGQDPVPPPIRQLPPPDPGRQRTSIAGELRKLFGNKTKDKPRDELWFPHLLIRAAPGDTGSRPLWEPNPCWLSPDLHLLPETGPVDLSQAVLSPTVGQTYRLAVHVWNLGRFPATGVAVRAWRTDPGFFDGADPRMPAPQLISGSFTSLGDRDSGKAHDLIVMPRPWLVENLGFGQAHQCLFATVESFSDPWNGRLASNTDRHVAQRNLTLMHPEEDLTQVIRHVIRWVRSGEDVSVLVGSVRPAALVGAAARGVASGHIPRFGAGPHVWGRPVPIGTIRPSTTGWTGLFTGSGGRRISVTADFSGVRIVEPGHLGVRFSTSLGGNDLRSLLDLSDPPFAFHLATSTGYAIVIAPLNLRSNNAP